MVLPSCKKGADDPFISLRSRTARLTGEWTISSGTVTNMNGSNSYTANYTSSNCTYSVSGNSTTIMYTQKITIEKDGTYKVEENFDGDFSTEEGAWYFGGKSNELELKAGQSIVFLPTKRTSGSDLYTYSGANVPSYTWIIDQLKNKEIVINLNGTSMSSGTISTTSGTMTYEQK